MNQPSDKAPVVDLQVHRMTKFIEAERDPAREQDVSEFYDQIKVAAVAEMLSGILDQRQMFQLITMIRKSARDATLDTLADALEAI